MPHRTCAASQGSPSGHPTMTTETQVEVAGTPAPVALADTKSEVQNTPQVTAAEGDGKQEQAKDERRFTQAELDAAIQKRLRKETLRLQRQFQDRMSQDTAPKQAPKREAFSDDEDFIRAQIEHAAEAKAREKLAQREQQEQQERIRESWSAKAEKAVERYPDFDAVVANPTLAINAVMVEYIADSDLGADVAYFLGKNPERAADIAEMSPVKAARELARIEAELAAKPKANPSKAPAPITPIGASAASTKSPAEMSNAEYLKWRKKGRA